MKQPVNNLEHLVHCPVCNKRYEQAQALLVKEDEGKTMLHLTCLKCNTSSLVSISMGQMGIMSLGVITDLGKKEVRRFLGEGFVSADEVLDTKSFMDHFRGSIDEILE